MGQKMLFLACLVVCAFAQVAEVVTSKAALEATTETITTTNFTAGNTTKPVPILRQINKFNADGSYTYGYEGGDGSFKIETRDTLGHVHGKYGYVDEFGEVKIFEYGSKKSVSKVPTNESVSVSKLPVAPMSTPAPIIIIQSDNPDLNTINSNKIHRKELVSAISKLLNIQNTPSTPKVTVQPESTSSSTLLDKPKSHIAPKVTVQSEILSFNTIKSRPLPQFTSKPNPKTTTTIRPIPQPLPAPSFQSQPKVQSQPQLQPAPQLQTKPQFLVQGQFPLQSQRHPHSQFQSQPQGHPHQFQSQPQFQNQHRFQSPSHFQSQFQPQSQFNSHQHFQHHPQSHTQHRFTSQPHFQSQIRHFPQSQLVAQSSSVSQTKIDPNSQIAEETRHEPIIKLPSIPVAVKESSTQSSAAALPVTPGGTSLLPQTSPQQQFSPQQLAQILQQLLQ